MVKKRFIVSDRSSGKLVAEVALDDTGRIWWSAVQRAALSFSAMSQIETDLAAGEASGTVACYAWVEVDETAAVRKVSTVN